MLSMARPFPSMLMFQSFREDLARELRSLIRVEDLRSAMLQSFLQGLNAKLHVHAVGQLPNQYVAAVPVHRRRQIQISPTHRNERDVARPHLIGTDGFNTAKQVRINLVTRR